MKILHCLPGVAREHSIVGFEPAVYHLTFGLAKLGHDVTIFNVSKEPPYAVPGVNVVSHSLSLRNIKGCRATFQDLADLKPDLVHLHHAFSVPMTIMARWLRAHSIPYVVTLHGSLSNGQSSVLKAVYCSVVQNHDLRKAEFLHVLSDAERKEVTPFGRPVVKIANGSCFEPREDKGDSSYLLKRYPDLNDKVVMLFVGRLNCRAKGVDLLLRGFRKCDHRNARLLLVGPFVNSSDEIEIRELIRALDLSSSVRVIEPIMSDEKFNLYASAHVFVQASRQEGMPLTVLEAAGSGLPCIVTPAASLDGDIARHGCGIQVAPTAEGVTLGLNEFLGLDESQRQEMGRRGKEMVAEKYSWPTKARELVAAYQTNVSKWVQSGRVVPAG